MGTSISEILRTFGGADPEKLSGIAIGGPSSGILPPDKANLPIKPGLIDDNSVMLGAGGIIAIGEDRSIIDAVRVLADYNASESCGKCTPCREGTPRILELLSSVGPDSSELPSELKKLANAVNMASLCGLGQAAGNPVLSLLHHFPEKY
jgi:NADH:ubiquinone oxidoreductase subunit F (NADH-binding)